MRTTWPLLVLTSVLVMLPGCGSGSERTDSGDAESAAIVDTVQEDLMLVDGWAEATDGDRTGVFGTVVNSSEQDISLARVESDLTALVELHVTVDGAAGGVMGPADDGFVVPAGGELVLEPGGDHLMLLQLDAPVETGQDLELTLVTADGQEYAVTATVRDAPGAAVPSRVGTVLLA